MHVFPLSNRIGLLICIIFLELMLNIIRPNFIAIIGYLTTSQIKIKVYYLNSAKKEKINKSNNLIIFKLKKKKILSFFKKQLK